MGWIEKDIRAQAIVLTTYLSAAKTEAQRLNQDNDMSQPTSIESSIHAPVSTAAL
jgi:hypothetical protein